MPLAKQAPNSVPIVQAFIVVVVDGQANINASCWTTLDGTFTTLGFVQQLVLAQPQSICRADTLIVCDFGLLSSDSLFAQVACLLALG